MRPRTNFVLALHGKCLHSNTYKNAFFTFVTIPALYFGCMLSLIQLLLTQLKLEFKKKIHMGDFDTI